MQRLMGRVPLHAPPFDRCCGCRGPNYLILRLHTTRPQTVVTPLSRRRRNNTKYVELLEVNKENMTETKAFVSKLKAKQLSNFVSNPNVSLGELHKITSPPKISFKNENNARVESQQNGLVDEAILQYIENKIMSTETADNLINDLDCAVIYTSVNISDVQKLMLDDRRSKEIKDSYDKFRRETLMEQKMKDLIFAIDDGVSKHINIGGGTIAEHIKNKLDLNAISKDAQNSQNILQEIKFDENDFKGITRTLEENEFQEMDEIDFHSIENIKPEEVSVSYKTKSKKKKKVDEEKNKWNISEEYLTARTQSLTRLLKAHISVHISNGSIDKAFKILKYYRSKSKKPVNRIQIDDISLYNSLIYGYAKEGDYNKICEVVNILSQDKINFDIRTFSAIFQGIQRSNMNKKQFELSKYLKLMESKNLQLNDLFNKAIFIDDDRQVLIKAIESIRPDFSPKYFKVDTTYDCDLVNSLNPNSNKKGVYNSSGRVTSPVKGVLTIKRLMESLQRQVEIEKRGYIEIGNIENKKPPTEQILNRREKYKEIDNEWRQMIHKGFLKNLAIVKAQSNVSNSAINVYPYLLTLDVDEFVDILLFEIWKIADGSETYSPSLRQLQKDLGVKIFKRYHIKKMEKTGILDKIINLYQQYCEWYLNKNDDISNTMNSRQKWQQLIHDNMDGVSLDFYEEVWPFTVCSCVGQFLYNIILNDVKIDINVLKNSKKKKYFPVLYSVFRGKCKMMRKEVKPHPVLPQLVRESCVPTLPMDANLVPSLCPPLPWTDVLHGGYLLTATEVMRIPGNMLMQMNRLKETPQQKLYPSLDSLNQLGNIPWIVNKPVLDVLLHVFSTGGSRALNIARPASSLAQPALPASSASKRERMIALRQRAIVTRMRQEMYSLWCDALYKLSLANHFRDEVFWLPHNMDFRGRVYPCPPHLSHLGADTSRALLVFARGKPLGPQGLKWLKLHCINLTGTMKKCPIQERLDYVESILDDILDSADKPLDGKMWWTNSDDPWQTLACCMEIANAIRSPNPEEYVCHFPVHQDGSCNGLQHYAALGRDSAGAYSVNLDKANRPQDVYSAVVTLVEAARVKDAEAGNQIAIALDGFVKRKVIKQTVMTTVYGVTKFGARLQIAKQLKDIDDFPKDKIWLASYYLAQKTFESIGEMFTSTREIQDWLTESAKLISGVCGEKIEWITPLGLPVIQPYFKPTKSLYSTNGNILEHSSSDQNEKPCVMKQKNAFPPNFIHSLDSSHMMLTSLYSEASDITFVSVHDCFWTHPSTVDIMNKICRDQFVALHKQPILEDLSKNLLSKFAYDKKKIRKFGSAEDISKRKLDGLLRRLPEKGDFNLENVLKSTYFFS